MIASLEHGWFLCESISLTVPACTVGDAVRL